MCLPLYTLKPPLCFPFLCLEPSNMTAAQALRPSHQDWIRSLSAKQQKQPRTHSLCRWLQQLLQSTLHLGSLRFKLKVQWWQHGSQRLGREPLLLLLPQGNVSSFWDKQLALPVTPHYSNQKLGLEGQIKHVQENLSTESSPQSVCGDEVNVAKGSSNAPESVTDTGRIQEYQNQSEPERQGCWYPNISETISPVRGNNWWSTTQVGPD